MIKRLWAVATLMLLPFTTLNAAIGHGVDEPAARERFKQLGAEAPSADQRSPEALARIHAVDVEKWGAVIKNAGITLN